MDIRSPERLAADRPVPAFEFVDAHPGNRAHVLALHGDHRLGDLVDEFLFLYRREDILDHIDRYQRHVGSPSLSLSGSGPSRAGGGSLPRRVSRSLQVIWRIPEDAENFGGAGAILSA